jgi:hypothetical protein
MIKDVHGAQALHDPGGKVKLALEAGIESSAQFSACGKYRVTLTRKWLSETARPGYVLWIGMNPSTADASFDDPTVKKERKFTSRWGYAHYVKCNVMDYRATKPKMLLEPGVIPCSEQNIHAIVSLAKGAALVILAFGAPHKKLRHYGERVVKELRAADVEMYCLGFTKDRLPVHPLYQLDSSEPIKYLT